MTTRETATTDAKAQCAAWRSIGYSGRGDTPDTVRQVRVHNKTGEHLGCWDESGAPIAGK